MDYTGGQSLRAIAGLATRGRCQGGPWAGGKAIAAKSPRGTDSGSGSCAVQGLGRNRLRLWELCRAGPWREQTRDVGAVPCRALVATTQSSSRIPKFTTFVAAAPVRLLCYTVTTRRVAEFTRWGTTGWSLPGGEAKRLKSQPLTATAGENY